MVEGASTITMQLSRTLFLSRERTWRRKVEEAFVAVELEKNYSKPQILTLYLNLVNLGHGNYGVEAASRYYFDKPAVEAHPPRGGDARRHHPGAQPLQPVPHPRTWCCSSATACCAGCSRSASSPQADYERAVAQPILVVAQQPEETFAPYFAEEVRKYLETNYGATSSTRGASRCRPPSIRRSRGRPRTPSTPGC